MWPDHRPTAALGAMRLSTDATRDDDRSVAVLHAAFAEGATLIDTAGAYALDASEAGHNERLIGRALATWLGERHRITVMTKGGLIRPKGRWRSDGRARHLRDACRASCEALAVTRLPLYQLHAPDPRVPWTTSVRALAALQRDGVVEAIGLCNVNVEQIAAAREIVPIATVQCELSPWRDAAVAGGVIGYCLAHGIRFFAYRPFGGVKGTRRVTSDPVLREVADARGVSAHAIVLAWLRGLAPHIVPLPGPTREETARDSVRAQQLILGEAEQTTLDRHFPAGRIRTPAARPRTAASTTSGGEVVLLMGLPGAGKSTLAAQYVAEGYERLNRDEAGGSLAALVPKLTALCDRGAARIVLDNTYLSRAARVAVIDAARAHGRAVRGLWLDTSVEEAQVNVVWRMLHAHGRLLTGDELRSGAGPDRLSPTALFRAQRAVERPDLAEGFAALDIVPFVRTHDPALTNRALILWCDSLTQPRVDRGARHPAALDAAMLVTHRARLAQYAAEGWRLFALSWEPQISERGTDAADVDEELARLRARVNLDITFHYCPHGGGPPVCWCRKPLPGLGVWLAHRHQLDVRRCVCVGATAQDALFARRLGCHYQGLAEWVGCGTKNEELRTKD